MESNYKKYYEFYRDNQDFIDQRDKRTYNNLRVRHFIFLFVGLSLSPVFYRASHGFIIRLPPRVTSVLTIMVLASPITGMSIISKKYFLYPHLEYIYKKNSTKIPDFSHLIENSEAKI